MTSIMKKYFLFVFIVIISGCVNNTHQPKKTIEAYFFPGDSDDSPIVTPSDTFKTDTAVIYKTTASEYGFLLDVAKKHKAEFTRDMRPPGFFIKMDSTQYIIGDNRVVKSGRKYFVISELEEYRIKAIIHYYDFMCEEDVAFCSEVRKYGVPTNYHCVVHGKHCIPRDRKMPLKVLVPPRPPLKKIILQVQ